MSFPLVYGVTRLLLTERGSSQALFAMLWLPQIPIACKRLVQKFLFTIRVWLRSINIPPSLCLLLKRRLCKAWLTCLSALLFSVSSPSLSLSCSGQDPPHRKPCCPSGSALGRGQAISIVEALFTFGFFILISRFLGQQPRELMHKLHEPEVLSGRGWADPFTRNAMPLTSPLAGGHRKKGRWGYGLLIQDHGLYKWFVIIWH